MTSYEWLTSNVQPADNPPCLDAESDNFLQTHQMYYLNQNVSMQKMTTTWFEDKGERINYKSEHKCLHNYNIPIKNHLYKKEHL